jgi:hypothetical protein
MLVLASQNISEATVGYFMMHVTLHCGPKHMLFLSSMHVSVGNFGTYILYCMTNPCGLFDHYFNIFVYVVFFPFK